MRLGLLICLLLISLLGVAAGPATRAPASQPTPAQLHGAWKNTISNMDQTYNFAPDGTWKLEWTGAMRRTESGTWKLDGPDLNLLIKASSNPSRVGRSTYFEIRRLTEDQLIVAQGENPDLTLTFERVK